MNRREFLQCAALLAAGSVSAPRGWTMNAEQHAFLAAQPNYIDREAPTFFTAQHRTAIAAVAEQIIPRTDTPGAADAGAPRFIELMVSDWLNNTERALFMNGLEQLLAQSGGDFAALADSEQLALLEQLEAEAGDASWYDIGNVTRIWDDTAPFICQVKELTVLGFMLSEVGSTQFLTENPMGQFKGDIPMEPGAPAYAAELPLRMIARD